MQSRIDASNQGNHFSVFWGVPLTHRFASVHRKCRLFVSDRWQIVWRMENAGSLHFLDEIASKCPFSPMDPERYFKLWKDLCLNTLKCTTWNVVWLSPWRFGIPLAHSILTGSSQVLGFCPHMPRVAEAGGAGPPRSQLQVACFCEAHVSTRLSKFTTTLDKFQHVWTCLNTLKQVWAHLNKSKHVWTSFNMFKQVSTRFELALWD